MKNKKVKYILMPIVILVWGLVFYQFFDYTNKEVIMSSFKERPIQLNDTKVAKDTFALNLTYNDPFLKKNVLKRNQINENVSYNDKVLSLSPKKHKKTMNQFQGKKPSLAEVIFGGKIINSNSETVTAILKVNGKNKLLLKGDEFSNIKILEIYSDSVLLLDQGEERTIKKQ